MALSMNRDQGGVARSFDDLAIGLESGVLSRGKALKLGGAVLMSSALGLFASQEKAEARRRCCRTRRCRVCCRRGTPCCGEHGCRCCPRGRCHEGRCRAED